MRMDFSVSVPPPSCSEGVCPPKQKTKTLCVFEVLGPVPPSLTGIHTQNAVNEFAGLCTLERTLEQLAQAAPHEDAPGGMSQRLPEQPQNGSDEPNIPGISFHPNLSWLWPWPAGAACTGHRPRSPQPPTLLRVLRFFQVLTSSPHRTYPSCWGLRIF